MSDALATSSQLINKDTCESSQGVREVECAWLLLLSSASGLLAPLAHYPLPSYHSKSPALVASGVFALEDFSLWLARARALFTGPPVVEPTSHRSL